MNISQHIRRLNAKLYPRRIFQRPEWIVLGVNNHCNLHCRMCDIGTQTHETVFSQNLTGSEKTEMNLQLFQRICDQMELYYPGAKLGLAFTEPLTYSYLFEGLKYAANKNLHTAVTTNGFELPDKTNVLCEGGCRQLLISIDGPEDVHNKTRGHGESFQRAFQGMENLFRRNDAPEISVFCVITHLNTGRLKEFADFMKKYPIKQLGFMHMNFTTRKMADRHNTMYNSTYLATSSNIDHSEISRIDKKVLEKEITSIRQTDYPFKVSFSPDLNNREEIKMYYDLPEQKIGRLCLDAFSNLMIKTDGMVIPSHGRCYSSYLGNMNTENLKNIWNSQCISQFRRDLIKAGGLFPACSRCCSAFCK